MPSFHASAAQRHFLWDNQLPPIMVVEPGDEVTLELADSSAGQIRDTDDASAIARFDFSRVNPCTGPIFVDGVSPGDDLAVTILDLSTAGWAWTANLPGFGLLSDDFPDPHLWISRFHDGLVSLPIGVDVPMQPMIGTIGVAPAAPGESPLLVPTAAGGNMDIAQIGAGATLHLPARVPGGLLSAGDAHAVQGDGEVCGTGAETSATVTLRIDAHSPAADASSPWLEHSVRRSESEWIATTGIGPDLFEAARAATRRAVDLISRRTGIDPIDAYLLLSLTGELRLSEVVDAPNWVVTMHVPARYAGGSLRGQRPA